MLRSVRQDDSFCGKNITAESAIHSWAQHICANCSFVSGNAWNWFQIWLGHLVHGKGALSVPLLIESINSINILNDCKEYNLFLEFLVLCLVFTLWASGGTTCSVYMGQLQKNVDVGLQVCGLNRQQFNAQQNFLPADHCPL